MLGTLATLALAAGLVLLSALLLARQAGRAALIPAPGGVTGWDLLGVGLFWVLGLPVLLLPPDWREELLWRLVAVLVTGFLGAAWLVWRAGGWREGRGRPERHLLFGAGCWLIALPGYFAVAALNQVLLRLLGVEEPVQEVAMELGEVRGAAVVPVVVLAVLVQPFLEELLFRGFLWRWLAGRGRFGPRRALFLSAAVFAVFHEPVAWLPILYLGGLFAWIYWRSGRLRDAWVAHALHNAMGAAAALLASHGDWMP